jgi:Ca2+-binding RTX toxin-like protein
VALFAARMSGGEAVNIIGNFADTLTNLGLIRGGVSMGGGDDLLINHGTMIATGGSAINMGEGNDGLFLGAGSVVAGAILMGGGNDYAVAIGAAASIAGGAGDDFYDIANGAVAVLENVGEGFDKVVTGVNYTLAAGSEVEWLQANAGDTGLTLTGNEFSNILVGSDGIDTLNGGGNDELHGTGGADHLNGGTGDDVYYVADTSDIVTEQVGQGFDKVLASANYTLVEGSEVEWLQANAGATGLTLTGNAIRNTIVGGDGADTLDGGGGPDALFGGAGADSFVFNLGQANDDQVLDFSAGDHLDFFGYGAGATLAQVGATDSYLITPDAGHGGATAAEVIHITNVFSLNTQDFLFH